MADVRAMLRAERASRAPPSKARKQAPAPAPAPAVASKKRKADDDDIDTRKRARPQQENKNLPTGFFDERGSSAEADEAQAPIPGFVPAEEEEVQLASEEKPILKPNKEMLSMKEQISSQPPPDNVNEAEWAAFQAFTTSVPSKTAALDALNSHTAISAAPLTTEQAAAQARDAGAQSKSRSKREEEIEEEKEEAAERLEEEFEVMGELEDRIKRLKEKREHLRRASMTSADGPRPTVVPADVPEAVAEEESEESEDDVDEFAGWRFGSR